MAKNSITDYDNIANNNTDIQSVDIAEGCAPSGINNAIREVMADLADVNDGTVTLTSPKAATLDVTGNLTVDTNTLYVDSTNNRVGVGTSSPSSKLTIAGDANITDGTLDIKRTTFPLVQLQQIGSTGVGMMAMNNDDFELRATTAHPMVFYTNNSERIRITSSGNVGIGTSSPATQLHIQNLSGNSESILGQYGTGTRLQAGAYSNLAIIKAYNGTNDALAFWTGSSERMRIDASGNVGIGVSSPSNPLEITGNVRIKSASGDTQGLNISSDGSGNALINAGYSVSNMRFAINGTERMRIDSSGNVGIGTSSPRTLLDLGANGVSHMRWGSWSELGEENQHNSLIIGNNVYVDGNTTKVRVTSSDGYRAIKMKYSDGITFHTASGSVTAESTMANERMRIDASGNVLLGKSTVSLGVAGTRFSSDGYLSLDRNFASAGDFGLMNQSGSSTDNNFHFCTGGTVRGTIKWSNTSTSYITTSDYRLKENVVTIIDGIERVKQLKPSRFNFIADADRTVDGFLAHEAATVVPEAVTGEKDAVDADGNPEYQGIDQSKLVPLLTAALQEAIAKIETLEARVAALEGN